MNDEAMGQGPVTVGIYMEGGVIQGIRSSSDVLVIIVDANELEECSETPQECELQENVRRMYDQYLALPIAQGYSRTTTNSEWVPEDPS